MLVTSGDGTRAIFLLQEDDLIFIVYHFVFYNFFFYNILKRKGERKLSGAEQVVTHLGSHE